MLVRGHNCELPFHVFAIVNFLPLYWQGLSIGEYFAEEQFTKKYISDLGGGWAYVF
jgi:hypothetical protein